MPSPGTRCVVEKGGGGFVDKVDGVSPTGIPSADDVVVPPRVLRVPQVPRGAEKCNWEVGGGGGYRGHAQGGLVYGWGTLFIHDAFVGRRNRMIRLAAWRR